MDKKTLYNILKYSFILEFLINKEYNYLINEYKIKLFKELIKIDSNYYLLLNYNNKDLLKELNKIIESYFINLLQ